MTLHAIEQKARYMDGKTFFLSYSKSAEYMRLPLATRREIIAGKYGLTWAEYSKLPGTSLVAMNLATAGLTYSSGVGEGVKAAQADARFAGFRGFFSGLKFGSTGLVLVAVAGALVLFHKPISRQLKALSS